MSVSFMLQHNWKCRACLDAVKLDGLVEVERSRLFSRSSGLFLGVAL